MKLVPEISDLDDLQEQLLALYEYFGVLPDIRYTTRGHGYILNKPLVNDHCLDILQKQFK